jgi:hypothetical protein
VNLLVLMELLRRKLGQMGFRRFSASFVRICLASAVMGLGVWGLDTVLGRLMPEGTVSLTLRVGAGVAAGAGLFLAGAAAAHLPEIREVSDMMKAVLARRGEENGVGGRR